MDANKDKKSILSVGGIGPGPAWIKRKSGMELHGREDAEVWNS
jgi:hypothetical protein